ncbi:hypothetical protein ERY13_27120 [Paenibacillus mucilaginosus]|uniref:hypothetical protein n=1 Tax=Paenibacillus mucilaginosus TaxID=61624 RepID=UPI0005A089BA|nr:hypothetical protein [Paenibacillus mucilaginosus]WFA20649.1 hypothetical protein ERY13_27120 [Paenibacillus mucilaginosus]
MIKHDFSIEGAREGGDYVVREWINGIGSEVARIPEAKMGGLKASRQKIGEILKLRGISKSALVTHRCIVPGRGGNPVHKWTVDQYLIGVPEKKKN